jgi:hypothetical protein
MADPVPKFPGQNDNPNIALTRPRIFGPLTLVDRRLALSLNE